MPNAATIGTTGQAYADDGGDDGGGGGGRGGAGRGGAKGKGIGGRDSSRTSSSKRSCKLSIGLSGVRCGYAKKSRSTKKRSTAKVRTKKQPTSKPVVATRSKGHELVVVGLDDAGIDRLRQNGFEIVESHQIGLLGANAARVRAPRTMGRKTALRRASALLPGGSLVVANDVFAAAPFTPESDCLEGCESTTLVEWTPSFGSCATGTAIGMIDTGVEMGHPVLAESQIVSRQFIAPDASQSSSAHGTAVASVLVGASRDRRIGLLDDVTIYAADAFHESSDGNRADTYSIVRALDWLASEPVKVINMSLSGPDNPLLHKAIRAAQDRNMVIVAAAGNERNAGAGYPARYEGVVAVSGVDHRLRKLRNANTGKHIDFAAPGADIIAAQTAEQIGPVRGTSFAAPFVAAAFAVGLNRGGDYASVEALLTASAKDLGNPGHDTTFGWGLIRYTALATRCE